MCKVQVKGNSTITTLRFSIIYILLTGFNSIAGAQIPDQNAGGSKGTVHVIAKGFSSDRGLARFAMFQRKAGFPGDSSKACRKGTRRIHDRETQITLTDVDFGIYAVSVFHDINENGKLDKKWHFIPEEGFGTSNNSRKEKQGATFEESTFTVDSDSIYIIIEIEYLFEK